MLLEGLLFDAYGGKRAIHEKLPPLRLRSSKGNTFAGFGQEVSRLPVTEVGNAAGVTGLEPGDREDPILQLEFDTAGVGWEIQLCHGPERYDQEFAPIHCRRRST